MLLIHYRITYKNALDPKMVTFNHLHSLAVDQLYGHIENHGVRLFALTHCIIYTQHIENHFVGATYTHTQQYLLYLYVIDMRYIHYVSSGTFQLCAYYGLY